jgi:catechol 2,3-dioxygenase-like lactoylglutathione lyase family enzyme
MSEGIQRPGAMAGSSDVTPARPAVERSLRLNHVTISTSDLARSIEFYCGLGLELIVRDDSARYARLLMPDGGATFSLHVADGPISRSGVVIHFECDDLDERSNRLRAAGYAFLSMPKDQAWLWREAMLEDPDGQRICLYYAGDNRKDPPWRLVDSVR